MQCKSIVCIDFDSSKNEILFKKWPFQWSFFRRFIKMLNSKNISSVYALDTLTFSKIRKVAEWPFFSRSRAIYKVIYMYFKGLINIKKTAIFLIFGHFSKNLYFSTKYENSINLLESISILYLFNINNNKYNKK